MNIDLVRDPIRLNTAGDNGNDQLGNNSNHSSHCLGDLPFHLVKNDDDDILDKGVNDSCDSPCQSHLQQTSKEKLGLPPNSVCSEGVATDNCHSTGRANTSRSRSSFQFCDVSGQLQSVFDGSSSNAMEDDSELRLDVSIRRVSSAGDLNKDPWDNSSSAEQHPNLIEASSGQHRRMQPTFGHTMYQQTAVSADPFNLYGPPNALARRVSAEVPRNAYPISGSRRWQGTIGGSGSRSSVRSEPELSFEERINRVLGPSFPSGEGEPWLSYQRHSEPSDIGSPLRKGGNMYLKRSSNGFEGSLLVSPTRAGPEQKKPRVNSAPTEQGVVREDAYVPVVRENDVLLGRGPLVYTHEGNQKFHDEKKRLQNDYRRAANSEKKAISQRLVDAINEKGGNFLRFDFATRRWYKVDNETARAKAAQALREDYTKEDRRIKREKYKNKMRSAKNKSPDTEATGSSSSKDKDSSEKSD